jgi:hypothetical protein
MHGMESFAQLAFAGSVPSANATVRDGPDFPWRGLMLDVRRRLSPVPLLENMLDTMAAAKLNVLHLHASDYCRWAVQSLLYPGLTDSLGPGFGPGGVESSGFYTQGLALPSSFLFLLTAPATRVPAAAPRSEGLPRHRWVRDAEPRVVRLAVPGARLRAAGVQAAHQCSCTYSCAHALTSPSAAAAAGACNES